MLEHVPEFSDKIIWEPCAGQGDIARVFEREHKVITSDIDPDMPCNFYADARSAKFDDCSPSYVAPGNLAIGTNPPFLVAFPILKNLYSHNTPLALLLRMSFMEPTEERGDWLASHPPDGLIVLPRISFTGDGKTDSVTCAWHCWNVQPFKTIIVPKSKFRSVSVAA